MPAIVPGMVMKSGVARLRMFALTFRDAFQGFTRKGDAMLGGAIAFYVMLSAAPLLVLSVGLAGLLFGFDTARTEVVTAVRRFVGADAAQYVMRLMREAREPVTGGVAAVLGVGVLGFGASRLFVHLQRTLNFVMGVRVRPKTGIKRIARDLAKQRAKSFAMVLVCGALLTLLLFARMVLSAIGDILGDTLDAAWLWQGLGLVVSFALFAVLFGAIYKIIPDVHLAWRDVWLGAVMTAVLLGLGTVPIGWFLAEVSPSSAYGAAGTLVAVLLFVYYSAQIFFLGAELTAAWARRNGSGIRPKSYAVRVIEEPDDQAIPPVE